MSEAEQPKPTPKASPVVPGATITETVETPKRVRTQLDYTTEPPAIFANAFNVTRTGDTFSVVFGDAVHNDQRMIPREDGGFILPARIGASARLTIGSMDALMAVMVIEWNKFADTVAAQDPEAAASIPRYARTQALPTKEDP